MSAVLPYKENQAILIPYKENQVIGICRPHRLYQGQIRTMYRVKYPIRLSFDTERLTIATFVYDHSTLTYIGMPYGVH